jgi:lysophospholipase L1-like esterase
VAQKDISNKLRWSALDVPPMEKRTYKSDHYLQRMDLFHSFPVVSDAVVFLGNSITERGGWHELLPGEKIANRGIGGDNVFGVLARLDDIIASRPQKIFLMIGINDLASRSWPVDFVYEHYVEIVDRLKRETPGTELFIQSVLPINEELVKVVSFKGKSGNIKEFNDKLKRLAYDRKITYIDVYEQLVNTEGQLDIQYTNDGIHLKPNAYKLWVSYLNENNYL